MVECKDPNCPEHGELSTRGRVFQGKVISDKMAKSVTIEIPRLSYVKKYMRYEKKLTKIKAHNPECINAKEGDMVEIIETRPISKTKSFVVRKIIPENKK
jgi:small subunit ribosomal protein S17